MSIEFLQELMLYESVQESLRISLSHSLSRHSKASSVDLLKLFNCVIIQWMPGIRTSSGTAYNVLITGIKYIVDAGYKKTLRGSNIGSYNRHK